MEGSGVRGVLIVLVVALVLVLEDDDETEDEYDCDPLFSRLTLFPPL